MLQCHRGQTDESIWVGCASFRELPILCGDQSASDVAIDSVPEGIDAEHFDVDSLGVHFPQTVWADDQRMIGRRRSAHHLSDAFNLAVGVDVDRFDSTSTDSDLAAPHRTAGLGPACRGSSGCATRN